MMRKIHRLSYFKGLLIQRFSQSYDIIDNKNSHLLYVEDNNSSLPFMSEIITDQGEKGIVIKLEERNVSVIGMYHQTETRKSITIDKVRKLKDLSMSNKIQPNRIYNIELKEIQTIKNITSNPGLASPLLREGKKYRLNTTCPILSICEDIFLGDFVAFAGPLGSRKTENALNYLQCFVNSPEIESAMGIYLSPNVKDGQNFAVKAAAFPQTAAFARGVHEKPLTCVGVYMQAIKCLQMAKKLKEQGKHVMLVIDNLHEILANEWTILQNLKLPLSSISILNELYSHCSYNVWQSKKEGSLTSIITTSPEDQDVLQEYTTLGNNSKYLRTLCPQIPHPLQLRVNNNAIISNKTVGEMRKRVNQYLHDKKESQLLTRLKLNKDDPWDQYYVLDSQWWLAALKKIQPKSLQELELLLWFVDANISEDLCAHWNITCLDAYSKYLDYLAHPADLSEGKALHELESFIQLCKVEGYFSTFKKDYL